MHAQAIKVYLPSDLYRDVAKQIDCHVIGRVLGPDLFDMGMGSSSGAAKKKNSKARRRRPGSTAGRRLSTFGRRSSTTAPQKPKVAASPEAATEAQGDGAADGAADGVAGADATGRR